MTIEELIERKEGQTFDCKSIQIEPKALAVTMVAMANADGGLLAIGISDKTRRIEGIDQNEERLNEILRVPFDFCHPSIAVSYSYLPCEDYQGNSNRILLIEVPASSFLHTNQADEAFLRVGDKSKYVKEFGEGIDRIFREQEANEADAPTFVMNEFILASTVRKSSKVTEDVGSDVTSLSPVMSPVVSPVQLTERQVKIYKLVKENPQISTSEMSPVLSVGIRTIKRDIIDMQKKGVVTREGNTSAGKWVLLMEI